MEYAAKGSLQTILDKVYADTPMSIDTARFFIAEIVLGLEQLHKINYVHRDLKPANILVAENCHLKLCDFGEAK